MITNKFCPQCGTPIEANAPGGMCAACLLKPGMEPVRESAGVRTTPFDRQFVAPSVAELAPHFPELEILQLLGQGGMGAVYQARQLRLDRLVAIKILPKLAGQEAEFANRFAREARAMARLNHPSIVNIHDYGDKPGWYFFIMEYVDGVNLRQAIQNKTVEPKEALNIVAQICDALQYAHQEGVVHRDIKPENILLDKRGRVKIADFGLAKLLGHSTLARQLTATNQVMGTVGYMAPEQLEGARLVDHRADLYAVGVVFYELLTGELPLGRFAPPSQKVHVDVRIDEVVLKTLEKEPDRRYQNASQIKQDVDQISRGEVPVGTTPRPQPTFSVPAMPWLQNPTWAGIALLVLGLLEGAIFFMGMLQLEEMKISYAAKNQTWMFLTMFDLFAGFGVAVAGMLIIKRKGWWLAALGAVVAMIPLAQMASFLRPVDQEITLQQLIKLAENQGIKFNPNRTEVTSLSSEARLLRDRILNMQDSSERKLNQLIYVRWPTILVTWLSIPAGLWALILLLKPEVKAGFGRKSGTQLTVPSPRPVAPDRMHSETGQPDFTWAGGMTGLLTVVCLGLGSALLLWISSAFLTGQLIRMPFRGYEADELTIAFFAIAGIGLILVGILFFNQCMRHFRLAAMSATLRTQFVFLTMLFSVAGLILLVMVIKALLEDRSLASSFSNAIVYESEAAGWISGFLIGGMVALLLALSPLDPKKLKRILFWIGVTLALGVVVFILVAPASTRTIRGISSPVHIPQVNLPSLEQP